MSTKRQPTGTPIGGEFATDHKAEASTTLTPPNAGDILAQLNPAGVRDFFADQANLDPDYDQWLADALASGVITDEELTTAITDRNMDTADLDRFLVHAPHEDVLHDEMDLTARFAAHSAGVENPNAPENYAADDVDAAAAHEDWTGRDWETYEDARAARQLEDTAKRSEARGRNSVVGGFELTGDSGQIRDAAQQALRTAETVYQVAGAKACAEDILDAYPNAAVLDLEDSDQEGCAFYGTRILDANGVHLADFEEFEDHDAALTDLPATPQYVEKVGADGTVTAEGDADFAFLNLEGSRRRGYTGRLDLRRAAAMDLAKVAA